MSNYVQVIAGLVVFYVGLKMFAGGMKSMAVPSHLNYWLGHPLWMFVGGIAVTILWQSSSLSTTLIVGLVASGIVPLPAAIAFTLGANIGTTFTAHLTAWFLSSGPPSGDTLRIAVVHTLVNLLMALGLLPFVHHIARLVSRLG